MERTPNFVERIELSIAVGLLALALSACADTPIAPISNTQNPNLPPGCEMVPMGADGFLTYDDLRRIDQAKPWTSYLVDPETQVLIDDRLVDQVVFTHDARAADSLPLENATPLLVAALRCESQSLVNTAQVEFQFYNPAKDTGFTDNEFYEIFPVIPQGGNNA